MARRGFVAFAVARLAGTAAADDGYQLAIDAEASVQDAGFGGSISLARVVATDVLVGGGAGAGWAEGLNTLDTSMFYTVHGEGFARWALSPHVHADVGVSVLRFTSSDDGGAADQFYGGYIAESLGFQHVFFTMRVRAGRAPNAMGEPTWGVIVTPSIRAVFDW